ncbi:pre-toxin TG domain-containing protein, partial [Bacillus sp. D-CC]
RAWDGVDPSTGEKLSTWDRIFAGGMASVVIFTPLPTLASFPTGVDPSTGEKLSTWDRIFAGGMAVAG